MEITPTNQTSSAQRISQRSPVVSGPKPTAGARGAQPIDRVELSPVAMFASRIRGTPEIRHEKVAELRQLINSNRYESPQKFEKAVERFLEELG